jgi:hypothetical protein
MSLAGPFKARKRSNVSIPPRSGGRIQASLRDASLSSCILPALKGRPKIKTAAARRLFSKQPIMRHMVHPVAHENEIVGADGSSPVSDFRLTSAGDLPVAPTISLFSNQGYPDGFPPPYRPAPFPRFARVAPPACTEDNRLFLKVALR